MTRTPLISDRESAVSGSVDLAAFSSPRQKVIRAAAVDLFYERGYHGTSIRDLARVLGMRAPSLYNHFESKQQLLQVIMLDDIEMMLREFDEAVASTNDTLTKIRRGTEAHVLHHTRYARESKVNNSEISALEEPVRSHLLHLRRTYAEKMHELLIRAVDEGVATIINPAVTSRAILDLGIGLARWFSNEGTLTDSTMAMYYGDLALRLVGAGTR